MAIRQINGWKEVLFCLPGLFVVGACSPVSDDDAHWEQVAADLRTEIVIGMAEREIEEILTAREIEWSRRESNLDWDSDHDPAVGPIIARYYAIERDAGGSFIVDRDIVIKIDVGPERNAVRVIVRPEYTGL